MTFTVVCQGKDPLDLRERLERFANEQWLPPDATREEAAEIVLDQSSGRSRSRWRWCNRGRPEGEDRRLIIPPGNHRAGT